jgi:hypothetical protein
MDLPYNRAMSASAAFDRVDTSRAALIVYARVRTLRQTLAMLA